MDPLRSPAQPGIPAPAQWDHRTQYPTPVPDNPHADPGPVISFPDAYYSPSDMLSGPHDQKLAYFDGTPDDLVRHGSLFVDQTRTYRPHHPLTPAYPSPSTASDNVFEETNPCDVAFLAPVMDAGNYPPHHAFVLNAHSRLGTCIDPAEMDTTQSPRRHGTVVTAAAACLAPDHGSSALYDQGAGPGVVSPHRAVVERAPVVMGNVAAQPPHMAPAFDDGRYVSYEACSPGRAAAPLATGLTPPPYLPLQGRGPVGIPRASPEEPARRSAGLARGSRTLGERAQDAETFPCLFQTAGCHRGFPGKNEWKRHVNTIHIRWMAWVCAKGECASLAIERREQTTLGKPSFPRQGKVFNRKDLYISHLDRRHGHLLPKKPRASRKQPSADQERVAAEACHGRIELPDDMGALACPVACCGEAFGGGSAWDCFLEHVADHVKKALASSPRGAAVATEGWIDGSLTRFGVAAGFLREAGAGRWRLCDSVWNDGPGAPGGGGRRAPSWWRTSTP